MSAGQRRFARRLLEERKPPPELDSLGYLALRDWISTASDEVLSGFIEAMKAQPYRRGDDRIAR